MKLNPIHINQARLIFGASLLFGFSCTGDFDKGSPSIDTEDTESEDIDTNDTDIEDTDTNDTGNSQETGDTADTDDTTDTDDTSADTGETPIWNVDAIVVAGDSWSTGSVTPTLSLLADQGHPNITVTYEDTAIAGSTAAEWAGNQDGKLDSLRIALEGTSLGRPEADVLLLYLGGNDYNYALNQGLNSWIDRDVAISNLMDDIESDLESLISYAQTQRPGLEVVIVGYDYLHFEWFTTLFGFGLDADGFLEYNQGLSALEERKLGIAQRMEGVHYAHNLGIWTHVLGNPISPPWSLPLADFPPGYFDAPSMAPNYSPFPGGCRRSDLDPSVLPPESLPGPVAAFDDGIHPSAIGWEVLLDNTWNQGLQNLIISGDWAP